MIRAKLLGNQPFKFNEEKNIKHFELTSISIIYLGKIKDKLNCIIHDEKISTLQELLNKLRKEDDNDHEIKKIEKFIKDNQFADSDDNLLF